VLGALDPAERRRVDEHLRGCPSCAAELVELETLPPLLAGVRLDDLDGAPVAPSPDLFERMSAAAAADEPGAVVRALRWGQGRRWLLAAAAALVVLGAGAGVASWAMRGHDDTRSVVAGDVHMTVTATAQGDGTSLEVTVAGVPARTNCTLVVVDADGHRHHAGEWAATYEGKAWFKGWSDVDRSDVEDVVLLGSDGQELARLPL
jgi:hypothetical protein